MCLCDCDHHASAMKTPLSSAAGCCCIDEFDKMGSQHQALLEAMVTLCVAHLVSFPRLAWFPTKLSLLSF